MNNPLFSLLVFKLTSFSIFRSCYFHSLNLCLLIVLLSYLFHFWSLYKKSFRFVIGLCVSVCVCMHECWCVYVYWHTYKSRFHHVYMVFLKESVVRKQLNTYKRKRRGQVMIDFWGLERNYDQKHRKDN